MNDFFHFHVMDCMNFPPNQLCEKYISKGVVNVSILPHVSLSSLVSGYVYQFDLTSKLYLFFLINQGDLNKNYLSHLLCSCSINYAMPCLLSFLFFLFLFFFFILNSNIL